MPRSSTLDFSRLDESTMIMSTKCQGKGLSIGRLLNELT